MGIWSETFPSSVSWISPSVDTDLRPIFSPNGQRLAFVRFLDEPFSDADRGLGGHRGPSFEVWIASLTVDDATGKVTQSKAEAPKMIFNDSSYGYPDDGT